MKREIRRDTRLPSFSLSIADLKLIWTRLDALFADASNTVIWVDVEFEREKLILESVDELDSTAFPSHESTNFTLHCHSSEHSLHLYTALHAGTAPRLVVTSGSEIWAAGAREVVLSILSQNKTWHHWLRPNLIAGLLLFAIGASVFAVTLVKARHLPFVGATLAGSIGAVIALGMLYFGRNSLLPMATLRLRATESFWRRHSIELTLALALVSALLTAYGLFAPRSGA